MTPSSWLAGLVWLLSSAPGQAARPQVVTVVVTDGEGEPVPHAWVRSAAGEGRRHVDAETGQWQASELFRPDGSRLVFVRGTVLDLTVTAPGYASRRVRFEVRSRRNVVEVSLAPLALDRLDAAVPTAEDLIRDWAAPGDQLSADGE